MTDMPLSAYIAPKGFERELATELERKKRMVRARRGRLFLCEGAPLSMAWAQNVWLTPRFLPARSIKDAASRLMSMQRNWALHESACREGTRRRAALIEAALPHVSRKPVVFGDAAPRAPLGAWTMWEADCILASPQCASPFADGEAFFEENRTEPPNRAYLKLWEAFTLLPRRPGSGEYCLDLGASPGGWTWVLASLGARVVSVDKAPLSPKIAQNPLVEYVAGSAFALNPETSGPFDWLCCDVVCYPERLLKTVRRWMESGNARNFVCTLKFQGDTDHETAEAFAAIPGSRLMHLSCNKHELTWVLLACA